MVETGKARKRHIRAEALAGARVNTPALCFIPIPCGSLFVNSYQIVKPLPGLPLSYLSTVIIFNNLLTICDKVVDCG
jgi:hypothetical protein